MNGGEMDPRHTPCGADCGQDVDVTARHISVERRYEEHDPPGHVMAIGWATGVMFHERCAPSDYAIGCESAPTVRARVEEAVGTFTFRGDKERDFARLVDVVMDAVQRPRPPWSAS